MRQITSHKINGVNDALSIDVVDEPGPGGASHEYFVQADWDGRSWGLTPIRFQKGPLGEAGPNGLTHEALLAIIQDRLECFQAGPYACEANASALAHVKAAQMDLHQRTIERAARGVEGTSTI